MSARGNEGRPLDIHKGEFCADDAARRTPGGTGKCSMLGIGGISSFGVDLGETGMDFARCGASGLKLRFNDEAVLRRLKASFPIAGKLIPVESVTISTDFRRFDMDRRVDGAGEYELENEATEVVREGIAPETRVIVPYSDAVAVSSADSNATCRVSTSVADSLPTINRDPVDAPR